MITKDFVPITPFDNFAVSLASGTILDRYIASVGEVEE